MFTDPSGKFLVSTLIICIISGAIIGGAVGGITAANSGQNIAVGIITGGLIGSAVGAVIGLGSVAILSGMSSVGSKFASDLIAYTTFGKEFGTWEDYAIAFSFGGLTKGLNLGLGGKFAADALLRPAIHQLAKFGTRGTKLSGEKYLFDVVTRATAFGLPSDLRPLYRGLMSGYYDNTIKGKFSPFENKDYLITDYAY